MRRRRARSGTSAARRRRPARQRDSRSVGGGVKNASVSAMTCVDPRRSGDRAAGSSGADGRCAESSRGPSRTAGRRDRSSTDASRRSHAWKIELRSIRTPCYTASLNVVHLRHAKVRERTKAGQVPRRVGVCCSSADSIRTTHRARRPPTRFSTASAFFLRYRERDPQGRGGCRWLASQSEFSARPAWSASSSSRCSRTIRGSRWSGSAPASDPRARRFATPPRGGWRRRCQTTSRGGRSTRRRRAGAPKLVFSGLDSSVAGEIEAAFAAGRPRHRQQLAQPPDGSGRAAADSRSQRRPSGAARRAGRRAAAGRAASSPIPTARSSCWRWRSRRSASSA